MIVVTGGTGMVGAHLLLRLLQNGEKVRAIRRNEHSSKKTLKIFSYYLENPEELFNSIEWIEADVTYPPSLLTAFENADEVFHCAGMVDFDPANLDKVMEINQGGTANVVNACLEKGVKKLFYTSSIAALGEPSEGSEITEATEWQIKDTNTAYSASKFKAEMEAFRGQAEGLPVCIVNPGLIVGPGEWETGSSAVFDQIWKGLKYYTDGRIGIVDVRDVVGVLLALREKGIENDKYIVIGENISIQEMLTCVADSIGRSRPTKQINVVIANIFWRVEKIRSMLTGKSPLITKDSIQTAYSKYNYSNKKLLDTIGYSFIPYQKSIKETGEKFLKDYTS